MKAVLVPMSFFLSPEAESRLRRKMRIAMAQGLMESARAAPVTKNKDIGVSSFASPSKDGQGQPVSSKRMIVSSRFSWICLSPVRQVLEMKTAGIFLCSWGTLYLSKRLFRSCRLLPLPYISKLWTSSWGYFCWSWLI